MDGYEFVERLGDEYLITDLHAQANERSGRERDAGGIPYFTYPAFVQIELQTS